MATRKPCGALELTHEPAHHVTISRNRDTGRADTRMSTKKEVLPNGDVEMQIEATDFQAAKREVEKIEKQKSSDTRLSLP